MLKPKPFSSPLDMSGPVGGGTTSILRRLCEKLSADERYQLAMLISPYVKTSNAFQRIILEMFDVPTGRSYDRSLKNLEGFVLEQFKNNKIPVVLIDEAQNPTQDCLQLIHYLLNFETATIQLLKIVLRRQEELAEKILRYKELALRWFPGRLARVLHQGAFASGYAEAYWALDRSAGNAISGQG